LDVDSDGDIDFVAALNVPKNELVKTADGKQLSAAFIVRNNAGSFAPERIPLPNGQPIVDFAVAKDTFGHEHLLLASAKSLFAYENGVSRLLFTPPSINANDTASNADSDAHITSVAVGDVTGDKLDDIVVLTTQGAIILQRMDTVDRAASAFTLNPAEASIPSLP
jgi:hypothetical protein